MSLFISIVNHNHDRMIINNPYLSNISKHHTVIIKSNTLPSNELITYCNLNDIALIKPCGSKGFSANNNEVFKLAKDYYGMRCDDYFLILNPDVIIDEFSLKELLNLSQASNSYISTINLFKNVEKTEYDNSIRHYHSIFNPIRSLLGLPRNDMYDKSKIKSPIYIEWAAGSFLLFKSTYFEQLNGFNEKYFMYFEDVDICRRANKKGFRITYFPQIEAVHLAAHNNRKILSRHLKWYLMSLIRYHVIDRIFN